LERPEQTSPPAGTSAFGLGGAARSPRARARGSHGLIGNRKTLNLRLRSLSLAVTLRRHNLLNCGDGMHCRSTHYQRLHVGSYVFQFRINLQKKVQAMSGLAERLDEPAC